MVFLTPLTQMLGWLKTDNRFYILFGSPFTTFLLFKIT
jgi:hypothetical protein